MTMTSYLDFEALKTEAISVWVKAQEPSPTVFGSELKESDFGDYFTGEITVLSRRTTVNLPRRHGDTEESRTQTSSRRFAQINADGSFLICDNLRESAAELFPPCPRVSVVGLLPLWTIRNIIDGKA